MKVLYIVIAITIAFCSFPTGSYGAETVRETTQLKQLDGIVEFTDWKNNEYRVEYHIEAVLLEMYNADDEEATQRIAIDYSGTEFSFSGRDSYKAIPGIYATVEPIFSDQRNVLGTAATIDAYNGIFTRSQVNTAEQKNLSWETYKKLDLGCSTKKIEYFVGKDVHDSVLNPNVTQSIPMRTDFFDDFTGCFIGWAVTLDYVDLKNANDRGYSSQIFDFADDTRIFATYDSNCIIIDPFNSQLSRIHSYNYDPKYSNENVEIEFDGKISDLFTNFSDESIKAFAMIMAFQENEYGNPGTMKAELEKLDFKNVKRFSTEDSLGLTDWDKAYGTFVSYDLPDGRTLVLTFINGTLALDFFGRGAADWGSDLKGYTQLPYNSSGNHEGFNSASIGVEKAMIQYMAENHIDPNKAFLAFDGYSRGAAISDICASRNSFAGVTINERNCLAITFGTPDTVHSKIINKTPWIHNHVFGNDPFHHVAGWDKYGKTKVYNWTEKVIDEFYNGKSTIAKNTLFREHEADSYIAKVFSAKSTPVDTEILLNMLYKLWFQNCPTNTIVFNGDEIVATVTDNVSWSDGSVAISTNSDGEKTIITPNDDSYKVYAEATADGVMHTSTNYLGGDEFGEFQELTETKIVAGKTYLQREIGVVETNPVQYGVTSKIRMFFTSIFLVDFRIPLIIFAAILLLVFGFRKRIKRRFEFVSATLHSTAEKRKSIRLQPGFKQIPPQSAARSASNLSQSRQPLQSQQPNAVPQQALNQTVFCPRCGKSVIQGKSFCAYCGAPLACVPAKTENISAPTALYLQTTSHKIPLVSGTVIYQYHLDETSFDLTKQVGLVRSKKEDPSDIGIKNVSDTVWHVKRPDEAMKIIAPGSTVKIVKGTLITIGSNSAEVV